MKIKRMMLGLALSAGFALTAIGCGGKAAADFEKIADKMCACKDVACVQEVTKEMQTWVEKNAETRGDKSAVEKVQKASERALKCAQDIAMKSAGGGE